VLDLIFLFHLGLFMSFFYIRQICHEIDEFRRAIEINCSCLHGHRYSLITFDLDKTKYFAHFYIYFLYFLFILVLPTFLLFFSSSPLITTLFFLQLTVNCYMFSHNFSCTIIQQLTPISKWFQSFFVLFWLVFFILLLLCC
jgi:hypothetical protein